MRALIALVAVAAGLALGLSEAAMRPDPGERLVLSAVFAGAGILAVGLGWWLSRAHRRLPSLRWTILAVATAAVVLVAAVVGVSARAMFLTPGDVRLVLAAVALGAGLGVLVAIRVSASLTSDLRGVAEAAGQVADGDLTVRTGIDRRDEVGVLATSVDRMVEQLSAAQQQRARGEAARQRLLTAIGHDLRTPLANLRAGIEAIQDGLAPDPDRYLRSMAADVDLLRSMVDDLFMLTRLEAGDLHLDRMALELTELAEGAVESITPLATRSGVKVELDADQPVRATGDPRALDRVLRNLLDNAVRHTPADGIVRVALAREGEQAVVVVADPGPGFPPDFLDRAFDVFERADQARQRHGGTGLGLAIARELVEAHGGTISIEPGEGATVACRFPAGDAAG